MNNHSSIIDDVDVVDFEKLDSMLSSGRKLRIKYGIDPTGDELHIGHAIPLFKLKEFQNLGHDICVVFGTFTAKIGDPTGRSSDRKIMDQFEIMNNVATYPSQIGKILNFSKVKVFYNHEWLNDMKISDFFHYAKFFNVSKILERDDFQKRLNSGLSLLEVIYPVLQAIDSIHLKADIEIGGVDQLLNMLCGRKLAKNLGLDPQVVMTVPLVEGIDGKEKMSKSFNNGIFFNDKNMYGKIMSTPDTVALKYYKSIGMKVPTSGDIYNLKKDLAYKMVEFYFDKKHADISEKHFKSVVSGNADVAQSISGGRTILETVRILISCSGVVAKRMINDGAVKINGKKQYSFTYILNSGDVLKIGKKSLFKVL